MAAADRCSYGQRAHFPAFKAHKPNPVPNAMCIIPGLPDLLPPITARQKKNGTTQRKQTKIRSNTPAPYSSISSGLGSIPPSNSVAPSSTSSVATGASCSGAAGAAAPLSRRGGVVTSTP